MNKTLLFLIFGTVSVLLSVIIISIGPITYQKLDKKWGYQNCELLSDQIKLLKEDVTKLKAMKNLCYRQKAMYNLEYSAFIINIVLCFVCADLALIHYLGFGKEFEVKTGIIGLISGIIGFVLTLVYICYSGYIFTNDVAYMSLNINDNTFSFDETNAIVKLYSNGAKYKWEVHDDDTTNYPNGGIYVTEYENDRSDFSNYIRYKDLGKKQYNYNSDYYKDYNKYDDQDKDENKCKLQNSDSTLSGSGSPLAVGEPKIVLINAKDDLQNTDCKNLYCNPKTDTTNKELYDRWLTVLILACFVLLCNLGLAFFGLMQCSNFGENSKI